MAPVLEYDDEASRRLEAMYVTPDVVMQRRDVLRALALREGDQVLDIGSGPGFLAREMALAVGPSGHVHGVDISESMLRRARERCSSSEIAGRVSFGRADATALPFPDNSFHAAVSTQVYEYVEDVPAALAELHRILRPGGRAVILDTDWDSIVWNVSDRALLDRILAVWEEHATDSRLPRTLSAQLREAGLGVERREVLVLFNPEYDSNTYSYRVSTLIEGFIVGRRGITQGDVEAWKDDLRRLGERGCYFFSLNRYLFLAVKPEERAP